MALSLEVDRPGSPAPEVPPLRGSRLRRRVVLRFPARLRLCRGSARLVPPPATQTPPWEAGTGGWRLGRHGAAGAAYRRLPIALRTDAHRGRGLRISSDSECRRLPARTGTDHARPGPRFPKLRRRHGLDQGDRVAGCGGWRSTSLMPPHCRSDRFPLTRGRP